MERFCVNCAHSYPHKETGPRGQQYLACRKAIVPEDANAADSEAVYCGNMRQGACGIDGKLWEPRNG